MLFPSDADLELIRLNNKLQSEIEMIEGLIAEETAHLCAINLMHSPKRNHSLCLYGYQQGAYCVHSSNLPDGAFKTIAGPVMRYLAPYIFYGIDVAQNSVLMLTHPTALYYATRDLCPDDLLNVSLKKTLIKKYKVGMEQLAMVLGGSVGLAMSFEPVSLGRLCRSVSKQLGPNRSGLTRYCNKAMGEQRNLLFQNIDKGMKAALIAKSDPDGACAILRSIKPVSLDDWCYSVNKMSVEESDGFLALPTYSVDKAMTIIHQ
jgi:hypothetical protein